MTTQQVLLSRPSIVIVDICSMFLDTLLYFAAGLVQGTPSLYRW